MERVNQAVKFLNERALLKLPMAKIRMVNASKIS